MHFIIWEYKVKEGREKDFEFAYGKEGVWFQFFNKAKAYLGTEILSNLEEKGTYITIDRWITKEAYEEFRNFNLAQYQTLDKQCEELTVSERQLGVYKKVG